MSFSEISLLLVVAGGFGIIARFLKQPLLIGFLFSGLLLNFLGLISDHSVLDNLGKIGVALLLFLVGLEMNIRDIKSVGRVALTAGLGQIIFTSGIGFLIAIAIGFTSLSAIYIAVALTFSSTIIVVKLLSEKDDINSLYGKIAVGFLLVQDFVAVIILMFLAGLRDGDLSFLSVSFLLIKAIVLFVLVWYLSKGILPRVFNKLVGNSQELLFTVSIAWALGLATLVGGPLGFSFEIGGFLAGLALSNLPDHLGISSKTRLLRDFFLTIFFVTLGSQLLMGGISEILPKAILLSIFVLVGNPLIVMLIMGVMGHKSRTSFLTSVTVAQISEFSFILMAMGKSLGHVTDAELALVVLVGAITMTGSTYLILGSEKIYLRLKNILKIFERKVTKESAFVKQIELNDHVVMVGCDKIGSSILPYFRKREIEHLVIDFNPSVFTRLSSENTNVLLGDITDTEIIDLARLNSAKAIICTIPNLEENLFLITAIKSLHTKPLFIGSTNSRADTIKLYEEGADYVLNPDIIAGEFLRNMFTNHGFSIMRISKMGKAHFNRMINLKS
ncbi:MAG: cation:proton antiporter [Patescibacteria group bacterium]